MGILLQTNDAEYSAIKINIEINTYEIIKTQDVVELCGVSKRNWKKVRFSSSD